MLGEVSNNVEQVIDSARLSQRDVKLYNSAIRLSTYRTDESCYEFWNLILKGCGTEESNQVMEYAGENIQKYDWWLGQWLNCARSLVKSIKLNNIPLGVTTYMMKHGCEEVVLEKQKRIIEMLARSCKFKPMKIPLVYENKVENMTLSRNERKSLTNIWCDPFLNVYPPGRGR
jgi:hypothetical protein